MRKRSAHRKRSRACRELNLLMRSAAFTNWAKSQPRQIWTLGPKREGLTREERSRQEFVGGHSWQLAVMGWTAVMAFNLPLDPLKVLLYGLLHDAGNEWYHGDTPAFQKNGHGCAEVPCRQRKAEREYLSKERLRRGLGKDLSFLMEVIDAFDAQADDESMFIYALDKVLADINITQDSGKTNIVLGADLPTVDLYKRQRVRRHPRVLEWYEELFSRLLKHEHKLFPKRTKSKEVVS